MALALRLGKLFLFSLTSNRLTHNVQYGGRTRSRNAFMNETMHLTASRANARRLARALRDAKAGRRMTRMSRRRLWAWVGETTQEGGKRARLKT